MTDAGRDAVTPDEARETRHSPEVVATANAYLERAGGDARIALVEAVSDGFAVAALVSKGFARWGQPAKRTRRD